MGANDTFAKLPHIGESVRRKEDYRFLTGAGLAGKVNGLPCGWLITSTDGSPMKEPPHPVLAQGKVRYVGDHVAMVVADTLEQAKNAAEAVDVNYDVLPAVVGVRDAAKGSALHDITPDNRC